MSEESQPITEPVAIMDPMAAGAAELTFGGAAEPVAVAEVVPAPVIVRGKLDRFGTAWGTGRRKTAVARVRVQAGTGKFVVNNRPMEEYFCVERDRSDVLAPLRVTEKLGQVDVTVNVLGGGPTGQAGAIILGIARALEALNPTFHQQLGENGFLTRDSRMVERKKYGYKKARKSFQFSKR
ncbi:MAG: 30S ribosomal protein S9 [Planctomycetales bacterium 12-60-4]|nr:MAG: 30S ribosomal protein S9 [Planctomycetales bacterium 12-60-4]